MGFIREPDNQFQSLAFKIFEYQFNRNENYRKFCLMEKRQPGNLKSWKEIPAMPTVGFKELILSTFPIRNAVKTFKTSGTTLPAGTCLPVRQGQARETRGATVIRRGCPVESRGVHFFDTLKLYEAAIVPCFKKHLMPDSRGFSFFYLISSPEESPHSSLSYMVGVVNKVFAKNRGRYYVKNSKILYAALAKDLARCRKKALILSTTFSLKGFLDFLNSNKITLNLPKGSRLMETGGFKGRVKEVSKSELYTECEKRLGISKNFIVSEYGMTELSSQFYHGASGVMTGPPWIKTLVMDPRTGREAKKGSVGILRHFDLANRGSVLAVQTEDLGRLPADASVAGVLGEGFQLLGRAKDAELRGCSLSYEEFLNS